MTGLYYFEVCGDLPTNPSVTSSGREFRVVAASALRAIQLAQQWEPRMKIHSLRRLGPINHIERE